MVQELQFEAGSALAKLAASDAGHTALLVQYDALPVFLGLLGSDDHRIVELSARAIGCIAGDSISLRNQCLSMGVIPPLVNTLRHFSENSSVLRSATSAISNLCRGHPRPALPLISPTAPALAQLLNDHVDETVAANVCDALSKLVQVADEEGDETAGDEEEEKGDEEREGDDRSNERGDQEKENGNLVKTILDVGAAPCLVSLLSLANSLPTLTNVLRLTSQILSGDDSQTQVMIEAGVIPALSRVLTSGHRQLLREVCFSVGNIASNTAHAQVVFESDPLVLPQIVEIMVNEYAEKRLDAAWGIGSLIAHGRACLCWSIRRI